MSRSKLVAVTAALTIGLAACASDDGDTGETTTEGATSEDGAAGEEDQAISGDTVGTVTATDVADDGTITVTVDTGDDTRELQASSAAYVVIASESGASQRTRLSTWLENNEFDPATEYTFVDSDGEIVQIRN